MRSWHAARANRESGRSIEWRRALLVRARGGAGVARLLVPPIGIGGSSGIHGRPVDYWLRRAHGPGSLAVKPG